MGKCDGHSIQESEFIKALRQAKTGVCLVVKNKPKNSYDLDIFLLRMKQEKQFLLNGETIKVTVPVAIQEMQEKPVATPANIHFHSSEKKDERQRIFLNTSNLYECRHQFEYSDDHTMQEKPGYFSHYDESKEIFYVTSSMAFHEWQGLIKYIAAHFPPSKEFHFRLAPGVQIEKEKLPFTQVPVTVKTIAPSEFKLPDADNPLVVSNDPELIVEKLKAHDAGALVYETALRDKANNLLVKERKKVKNIIIKNNKYYRH